MVEHWVIKEIVTDKFALKQAQDFMTQAVKNIRTGKVITRRYAARTVKRRRRAGLRTNFVDATGSKAYDGRTTRTLDDWYVRLAGPHRAQIIIRSRESYDIYRRLTKRYGQLI